MYLSPFPFPLNRIATEHRVASDGNPSNLGPAKRTEFLTDDRNHTGYSQVLQEIEFDDQGTEVKRVIYTVGHDQLVQTVIDPNKVPEQQVQHHYFGYDGHGSVRALFGLLAAIVEAGSSNIRQQFHFDAYGNLLDDFNATDALTSYLYSGESFDKNINQQYLRARWYDATTGRFNRLDPFFGNLQDPQSLHKYAYVHADPIQGIDPSGLLFVSTTLGALGRFGLRTLKSGAILTTLTSLGYGGAFWAFGLGNPIYGTMSGFQLGIGLSIAKTPDKKRSAIWTGILASAAELVFGTLVEGKSVKDRTLIGDALIAFSDGVFDDALGDYKWKTSKYHNPAPNWPANNARHLQGLFHSMIVLVRGAIKTGFSGNGSKSNADEIAAVGIEAVLTFVTTDNYSGLPSALKRRFARFLNHKVLQDLVLDVNGTYRKQLSKQIAETIVEPGLDFLASFLNSIPKWAWWDD